jgi:hypothetical protein
LFFQLIQYKAPLLKKAVKACGIDLLLYPVLHRLFRSGFCFRPGYDTFEIPCGQFEKYLVVFALKSRRDEQSIRPAGNIDERCCHQTHIVREYALSKNM